MSEREEMGKLNYTLEISGRDVSDRVYGYLSHLSVSGSGRLAKNGFIDVSQREGEGYVLHNKSGGLVIIPHDVVGAIVSGTETMREEAKGDFLGLVRPKLSGICFRLMEEEERGR